MVTVYAVQEPGGKVTRLHLPATTWGNTVLERLAHVGYAVQAMGPAGEFDTRDIDELTRRDAILEWAAPDE